MSERGLSNQDWIVLVKATREKFGVSIRAAHELILTDESMRRLVALRVNSDQECRKLALEDIRYHGEESIFIRRGERLIYRNQAASAASIYSG